MTTQMTPEERERELELINKNRKPRKPKEPHVSLGIHDPNDDEALKKRALDAAMRLIKRNAEDAERKQREWDELPKAERRRLRQERLDAERAELDRQIRRFLPPLYKDAAITRSEIADWAEDVVSGKHHGRGLLLVGPTGTGKTFNIYGIIRYLLEHHYDRFLYWQTPMLLSALRPRPDSSEWETLNPCFQTGALVLDDIGAHNPTPYATEKLFSIIDYRITHMLPTIYATNYTPEQAPQALGDRIHSRIVGSSSVVPFVGEDKRRAVNPHDTPTNPRDEEA